MQYTHNLMGVPPYHIHRRWMCPHYQVEVHLQQIETIERALGLMPF